MIYAVQELVRATISAGSTHAFVLEDQIDVQAVMDAAIRFYNPTSVALSFKVEATVAQSGVFSDTFTLVDESVAAGALTSLSLVGPVAKDSLVTHTVTFTNADAADQTAYAVITGWSDIKTVLSDYIGTKP